MIKDIRRIIYSDGFDCKVRIGNKEIQVTEQELEEFFDAVGWLPSDELMSEYIMDYSEVITIDTIKEIIRDREYDVSDLFDDDDDEYYKNTRVYNKREKIIELFKSYYDDKKTKKEVFIQIADELNISFKAVEKAFYSKN